MIANQEVCINNEIERFTRHCSMARSGKTSEWTYGDKIEAHSVDGRRDEQRKRYAKHRLGKRGMSFEMDFAVLRYNAMAKNARTLYIP